MHMKRQVLVRIRNLRTYWRSRLMKSLSDVKFSTLDLVPVRANGSAAQSLRNSLDLAQHVEKFGYNRFWVAEHHTLESLYPGRIDLGLGRAPGSDQMTARALRRERSGSADDFPEDVAELMAYLGPRTPDQRVIAVPGTGTNVPA